MSEKSTSQFISLILRHKPDVIGITLDEHGWANVEQLIEGIRKTQPMDMELLEKIVSEDKKQRYSFNEDKTLIRANQGHSIPVDVELEKKMPPDILWHGKPVVYQIDAKKMYDAGYEFYLSVNGVWLTKEVPVQYFLK